MYMGAATSTAPTPKPLSNRATISVAKFSDSRGEQRRDREHDGGDAQHRAPAEAVRERPARKMDTVAATRHAK